MPFSACPKCNKRNTSSLSAAPAILTVIHQLPSGASTISTCLCASFLSPTPIEPRSNALSRHCHYQSDALFQEAKSLHRPQQQPEHPARHHHRQQSVEQQCARQTWNQYQTSV